MKSEDIKNRHSDSGKNRNILGLCLGASTVSAVHIEIENGGKPKIVKYSTDAHGGNPRRTLVSALSHFDMNVFDRIAATGRRFRQLVNLSSISEPEAVEYAYSFIKPEGISCPAVVSAGGETFMIYVLNRMGQISNVLTGNKCASGTGEFFLQQLRRMNVTLDEAAQWAAVEEPYHVSGRCSVFCKSDCTHATNKGIPKSKVTAGLCRMMANKILELLKKVERKNIMITGGTSQNRMMIEYLKKEIDGLIVPEQAPYFEALGAALWADTHDTMPFTEVEGLFKSEAATFDTLPPLQNFIDQVKFKTIEKAQACSGDVCILGLDVGSTTTKAVLMRKSDNAMLAQIYLRTNGDPIGASRKCYEAVLEEVRQTVDPSEIIIEGLGVCGSGRQIAGLHALTNGIINEIIAHAAAAVYFDPKVDTIFEIGGQDAKYTYITNAVASDYAMNEACSAGTGSFLEESAYETLGVKMEDIADIALKGKNPPNFNDQCAAFIASDIKNAIHEGVKHEDIIAGLVYSICMNYSNRVKGSRPMGEKVFMQGGVCYNRAVPLAMAALTGKPIIVPPEPGLMGAYGVALEVKRRIDAGLMKKQKFDIQVLANREVKYGKSFTCGGGKEKCDRRCTIAMIEIEGEKHPFGGACNRYYNLRHNLQYDVKNLDIVKIRKQLVFNSPPIFEKERGTRGESSEKQRGSVGINRSFLVNTYYPLYSTFFSELGFTPVIPDVPSQEGIDRREAAFCYPGELAHGFFHSLLKVKDIPKFIFLPHFKAVPLQNGHSHSQVCPIVQGEPFYLQTTFRDELEALKKQGVKLLTPLIDMREGLHTIEKSMIKTALQMGVSRKEARSAFQKAVECQMNFITETQSIGKRVLDDLVLDPEKIAVIIFGRPYNAFVDEAHMGIPHKLASRGVQAIPLDFIPLGDHETKPNMYWGMGQLILNAAQFVKDHPQLFGTFITNFSCGPDSFLIGYFREIMGRKPSLTLELDSHTADAGIETRIEAFLDIVAAYRKLEINKPATIKTRRFSPARTIINNGVPHVITSSGQTVPFTDPRVTFLLPSMGPISTQAISAAFRESGFNAVPSPPADEAVLKLGRANTSCKECLPLILTTGALLNYVNNGRRKDEIVVYFMATATGPCRFGQYYVFMEDLIKKFELPDTAMFSLSAENAYAGLKNGFHQRAWWAIVIADVMENIRSMILANAVDTDHGIKCFEEELAAIIKVLEKGTFADLEKQLDKSAEMLSKIPMKQPPHHVPTVLIVGEIFVRRDHLSRQYLTERLAKAGFASVCAGVDEWMVYANHMVKNEFGDTKLTFKEKLKFMVRKSFMDRYERRIKSILSKSGLIHTAPIDIKSIIKNGSAYISPYFTSESILTVGTAITDVIDHACGVIAIGPFGCMPNRVAEAILNKTMNREGKLSTDPHNQRLRAILEDIDDLPFLAIESDGSPFPQLIGAKLESFCLRAERLHQRIMEVG